MRLRVNPGALFTLFVLLLFFGGVFTARQWQFQARLFPWTIGIPVLLLCVAQLAMDLFRATKSDNPDDLRGLMDLPVDRSVPVSVVIHRAINSFGWFIGFFLVIWLIGFIIALHADLSYRDFSRGLAHSMASRGLPGAPRKNFELDRYRQALARGYDRLDLRIDPALHW